MISLPHQQGLGGVKRGSIAKGTTGGTQKNKIYVSVISLFMCCNQRCIPYENAINNFTTTTKILHSLDFVVTLSHPMNSAISQIFQPQWHFQYQFIWRSPTVQPPTILKLNNFCYSPIITTTCVTTFSPILGQHTIFLTTCNSCFTSTRIDPRNYTHDDDLLNAWFILNLHTENLVCIYKTCIMIFTQYTSNLFKDPRASTK